MSETGMSRADGDYTQLAQDIANQVVKGLQESVLKISEEVTSYLKPWAGQITRMDVGGPPHAQCYIETMILTNGGIRLVLISPNGQPMWDRVLGP